jgi:lariat debranching enzyme
VRKKLEERQFKPFEFARTVPAYNPSQRVFDSIPEIPQNPQTLSLLELLGLPYLLDSSPVTGERTDIPASLAPSGMTIVFFVDEDLVWDYQIHIL